MKLGTKEHRAELRFRKDEHPFLEAKSSKLILES